MTETTENAVLENETETDEIQANEETETNEANGESEDKKESNLAKIREETIHELIQALEARHLAYSDLEALKTDLKGAKNILDAKQEKMNRLVADLRDIENGNYQNRLDFDSEKPAVERLEEDPAKTTTLSDAVDNGNLDITPSQLENLVDAEIGTIAQLEDVISHGKIQNISGIGEKAINRITDAVLTYRKAYPVPVEEDDRVITDQDGNLLSELVNDTRKKLAEEAIDDDAL